MRGLVDDESRQEKEEVERLSKAGFAGAQVARGNLSATPFPEVLAQLYRWRSTGALLLRRDKIKKIVYLKDGYPFSVKSNLMAECLGRIMVRERMISEADCETSIRKMKETGRQQGTLLIEMGSISPHNLVFALQLQLEAKLYEIFSWTHGDYQFNPKSEIPASTTRLEASPASIILEGIRRTWDEARLAAQLRPALEQFVAVHPDPLQSLQEFELSSGEEALVGRIDGSRTVKQLLADTPLAKKQALSLLYGLTAAQVVVVKSNPGPADAPTTVGPPPLLRPEDKDTRAVAVPTFKPPPLIKRTATAPSLPPPLAPPPTPAPVKDDWQVPVSRASNAAPEDRDRVEHLSRRVKEMRKMTYFEMLGISKNASMEEVKKAYFSQAKDYHPDKHFGSPSAEVKALADQIYSMLSTAYEVLSDPRDREEYLRGLRTGHKTGVSDEVSRILAAEAKFQKGELALKKKDWARAHGLFKEAVELYPDEGEFHSYLGWSLYNSAPTDSSTAARAEKHMDQGLQLNPKFDKGYLFLGWMHKALGRRDVAERQFEKAIQCNPDCTEALRELRLMSEQKDPSRRKA